MANEGCWKDLREQEQKRVSFAAENRRLFELVRPLPEPRHVQEMLDVAYLTSLLEEEGRRVHFTLGYLSPKGAAALNHSAIRFGRPKPFRPRELAKVALAATPAQTTFGVWPSQSGDLRIWGFTHHGDETFAIDLKHTPTYFSLNVLRPGTFTVHYDKRIALLFSRDHYHVFRDTTPMGFDITGLLREGARLDGRVARTLIRLAQRMYAHGHGGTILFVDKDVPIEKLKMNRSHTFKGGAHGLLKDAQRAHENFTNGTTDTSKLKPIEKFQRRQRLQNRHAEALDFVARLTAVDGAVVLQSDLGLLGFGATIVTSDEALPDEVSHVDPRRDDKRRRLRLEELGGNRHRSAVCFCAHQTSLALALVCSQDGDLSIIGRRKGGKVLVVRPYELALGF